MMLTIAGSTQNTADQIQKYKRKKHWMLFLVLIVGLGAGTAYLRFQSGETQIDLDDAVARIARAVNDFFALNGAANRKEAEG